MCLFIRFQILKESSRFYCELLSLGVKSYLISRVFQSNRAISFPLALLTHVSPTSVCHKLKMPPLISNRSVTSTSSFMVILGAINTRVWPRDNIIASSMKSCCLWSEAKDFTSWIMKTLLSVVVGSIVALSLLECVSGAPVIARRRQGKVSKITKQHNHNATLFYCWDGPKAKRKRI